MTAATLQCGRPDWALVTAIPGARPPCLGWGWSVPRFWLALRLAACLALVCAEPALCQTKGAISYDEEEDSPELARMPPGERAARKACTICHAFVEPNMLTRTNWQEQILPRMKVRLGVALPDWSSSPEGELIKQRKVYTDRPLMPVEDWPLIRDYYLTNAPLQPLPQDPRTPIAVGLPHFQVARPRFRTPVPASTLVKIDSVRHRIFVGDEKEKALYLLDTNGLPQSSLKLGNVPVDVTENERGLYVLCIGSFLPSEVYRGELLLFEKKGDGYGERKVLLKELPRPVQMEWADFNGDGRKDFALCMFGNLTGRFSWFENQGNDRFLEHVLSTKAGSMYSYAHDFNGDKKPDLAVIMAQELEMIILLENDGKGSFTGDMLFQKPPVFGHSYFEIADFNKDGKGDLVVVNGDNGEYESPLKPYHGIRILMNRGDNSFEEKFFYPLNGVYKAMARDFDGDGDLDMAAISFFPDYREAPQESFVYFQNEGNFRFRTMTFRECISGRWLTMDVGDVDGDGDLDIVLGSYAQGPTAVPAFLFDTWSERGASMQLLRNTLRE